MINTPEGLSAAVKDLFNAINEFLIDCAEADKERGNERVAAFVKLSTKHEMFSIDDAINFANHPIDKPLIEA